MDNDGLKSVINGLKCLGEYIQGAIDSHRDDESRSVLCSIIARVEDIMFYLEDFVENNSETKVNNE